MISDGENSVVVGRSDVHDGELLIPSISEILVPGTWAEINHIFCSTVGGHLSEHIGTVFG